jgi:uncharacterized membrane protein
MHEWSSAWYMENVWMLWFILVGVIIFVVWSVIRTWNPSNGLRQETPEQILKRRFASGDIDYQEYQLQRKQLRE